MPDRHFTQHFFVGNVHEFWHVMIKNQFRIYVKLDIDMHMNRQSDINLFNNMPNLMRKLVFFLALQISLFPYQLSQQICFKKSQLSQNKIEVERKRQHFFMHQWRWWRRDGDDETCIGPTLIRKLRQVSSHILMVVQVHCQEHWLNSFGFKWWAFHFNAMLDTKIP